LTSPDSLSPSGPLPDALTDVPLFPLGTVLFPGGLLPLRIFEVRYLDMVRRCQREGRPFGIVALTRGQEVRQAGGEQEAFSDIGTLATLVDVQAPRPGLMMIKTHGGPRFRIRRSAQQPHGLWVGDLDLLPEDPAVAVPSDLQAQAQALGRVLETLTVQAADAGAEVPVRQPWQLEDCAWVANRWCELLPLPVAMKQRLMTLDNPLVRLELVGDLLAQGGGGAAR
jgi:Lon protease-like protein